MDKIAVIIPHLPNERIKFFEQCIYYVERQTKKPDYICIVDDEKKEYMPKDVSYRYKVGINKSIKEGCNIAFFIEDDDWYSENYIQTLYNQFKLFDNIACFGYNRSMYYNINLDKYRILDHPGRSSAFNTVINLDKFKDFDLKIRDDDPFFDLPIWKRLGGMSVFNDDWNCIGIKHGIDTCGGAGHNNIMYKNNGFFDEENKFLISIIGEKDFEFYKKIKTDGK